MEDNILNDVAQFAEKQGEKKGAKRIEKKIVKNMLKHNFTIKDITLATNLTPKQIKNIQKTL